MKYTIGEFASLIGVTADTLRLYEKKGIIAPYKDEENAYRYYSDLDVRQVLMSRWYRSLMIPLERVSEMTTAYSREEIEVSLESQYEIVQKKIEKLQQVKVCIRDTLQGTDEVGSFHKMELPSWYRMSQTQENKLHVKEEKTTTAKGLMDLLPLSFYTCAIRLESFSTQWGLAIEADLLTDDMKLTYKIDDDELEYYEKTQVVRTTIELKGQEELEEMRVREMLQKLKQEGYKTTDKPILAKLLYTDGLGRYMDNKTAYIQLFVPISDCGLQCS